MNPVARRLNAYLQLVFALVLFLSVNAIGEVWLSPYRLDLTEDRLFTVSPGAKIILGKLTAPVTLTYYFSETAALGNPPLLRYGRRVKDFLKMLERAGGARVSLRVVDVSPFSPEEDEATLRGMQPLPGAGGQGLFMGLAVSDETDRLETVTRFAAERDRFLEHDVMKAIYLLAREGKPRVGLLTSLPMRFGLGGALTFLQGQGQPYILYAQLAQFFDVVNIELGFSELPPGLEALLIVHPPELSDVQLYAIDQAVLAGLPALVFVDPYAEVSELIPEGGYAGVPAIAPASALGPLLAAWGFAFDPEQVVVDRALAQKAEVGGGNSPRILDYPNWLGVRASELNADNPATAELALLNFASAGALFFSGGPELAFTPQVMTSHEATLVPAARVAGDFDPAALMAGVDANEQLTLVAEVTGIARSAFDAPPEGVPAAAHAGEGVIRVWVGADSDIFDDRFWARFRRDAYGRDVLAPIADNAAMIVNVLDQVAGEGDLASLQPRGVSLRPLEVFEALKRAAAGRMAAEEERLKASLTSAEQRLLTREAEEREGLGGRAAEEDMRKLREEVLQIRQSLRAVERRLREDVAALEMRIILLNSALVPGVLLLLAGAFWLVRRRRARP
ncbi:MAG TPA: Gldg family protein [Sphingomonadales bacterium]|nr:Gldg family protein [Sphingomonadales bacterium]